MEYLANNTHIAAQLPAAGRTLLFYGGDRAYLYFPQHLFVVPKYIDSRGHLRIKETRGISLYFKHNDKLYIPHLPDLDGCGGICISDNHGIISAPPVDALNHAINQFFSNISRFLVSRQHGRLHTWIEESKQNKCPLHLFWRYHLENYHTLKPISTKELKELK